MNICLLGNNLSNLVLAKNLLDREIKVDLYYKPTIEKSKITRTIGISKDNQKKQSKLNLYPFYSKIKSEFLLIFCSVKSATEHFINI